MEERLEEERKRAQNMEEQRLKRCQKKKERDDLRKKEEAEQKSLEDVTLQRPPAIAQAAVSPDVTSENRPNQAETTSILSDLNQGLTEPETSEIRVIDPREKEGSLRSPTKKKLNTGMRSLKAATIQPNRIKLIDSIDQHVHKYPRVIIEAGISLSQADPFQEFICNLQHLLKNGQLVDPKFAFCPVN